MESLINFKRITSFKESSSALADQRTERGRRLTRFGVSYLDDALGGILESDLILLGAQTGAGKTALATHLAAQVAATGKKVLYFALEADKNEIEQRLAYGALARRYFSNRYREPAEISFSKFYLGQLEEILKTSLPLEDDFSNIYFRYSDESYGIDAFTHDLNCYKDSCDMIVLDHLHYLDLGNEENKDFKNAVKQIRSLALEHRKPVILVAQLRKKTLGNQLLCPVNDDFHGSSDITKIATKVITIAPAHGQLECDDPTQIPTFMRAAKYRLDGSVARFIAALKYDIKTGTYLDGYKLGVEKYEKKNVVFEPVDFSFWPKWAKGAR